MERWGSTARHRWRGRAEQQRQVVRVQARPAPPQEYAPEDQDQLLALCRRVARNDPSVVGIVTNSATNYVKLEDRELGALAQALPGNTHLRMLDLGGLPNCTRKLPKALLDALPRCRITELSGLECTLISIELRRKVANSLTGHEHAHQTAAKRMAWAKAAHQRLAVESTLVGDVPIVMLHAGVLLIASQREPAGSTGHSRCRRTLSAD